MGKFQSTKIFDGYSVALRQHKAQHSHCCMLHGYSFYFHITFASIDGTLDETNWIQDYGSFKHNGLKEWLTEMFDHTVLIEQDDPMRPLFEEFRQYKIGKVHFLEKMGMESIAKMVFDKFNDVLSKQNGGRVKVIRVEAFEHPKNSAIYSE